MNKNKLMMAVWLAALAGHSATVLDLNYDSDTVGVRPAAPPSGSITFSPSANAPGANSITVIGSLANTAGTGNGVELVDNSAATGTRLEYDLSTSQSVIRWDFSFSALASSGSGANQFFAAVMNTGGSSGASATRLCAMRLQDNATVAFYAGAAAGGAAIGAPTPVTVGAPHTASMFLNDLDEPRTYTDPTGAERTLAANSVDFWLDGVFKGSGALASALSGGLSGLGRVGFGSTSGAVSLFYAIDNMKVTQVLPPPSAGSLSLYLVGE
jgi:hypothetical protein